MIRRKDDLLNGVPRIKELDECVDGEGFSNVFQTPVLHKGVTNCSTMASIGGDDVVNSRSNVLYYSAIVDPLIVPEESAASITKHGLSCRLRSRMLSIHQQHVSLDSGHRWFLKHLTSHPLQD